MACFRCQPVSVCRTRTGRRRPLSKFKHTFIVVPSHVFEDGLSREGLSREVGEDAREKDAAAKGNGRSMCNITIKKAFAPDVASDLASDDVASEIDSLSPKNRLLTNIC